MQFYCVAIVGPPTRSIKQASAFALAHNPIFTTQKCFRSGLRRPPGQGRDRLRLTDAERTKLDIRSIRPVEYLTDDALLEQQRKKNRERQGPGKDELNGAAKF
jgi:hypothetical protein